MEFRSYVKEDVDVLVFNSPYGLCGRKATPQILTKILDLKFLHKFRTSNFCINSGPQIPT